MNNQNLLYNISMVERYNIGKIFNFYSTFFFKYYKKQDIYIYDQFLVKKYQYPV